MSTLDSGGAPLDKSAGPEAFNDFDKKVRESLTKVLWTLPRELLDYLVQYLALNQPPIPIGQVFGFSAFTASPAATIATSESTTSITYGDLATAGPSLTDLPDGVYLLVFGAALAVGGAGAGAMSVSVNGGGVDDGDSLQSNTPTFVPGSRMVVKTLSAGANTVTAKYRAGNAGVSTSFYYRWLVALKYAND